MSVIQAPFLSALYGKEREQHFPKATGEETVADPTLQDVFSKFIELNDAEIKIAKKPITNLFKKPAPVIKKISEDHNSEAKSATDAAPFDPSFLHEDSDIPDQTQEDYRPTLQNIRTRTTTSTERTNREEANLLRNLQNLQGASVRVETSTPLQTTPLMVNAVPLQFTTNKNTLDFSEGLANEANPIEIPQSIGANMVEAEKDGTSSGFNQGNGGFDSNSNPSLKTPGTASTAEETIRQTQIIQQILADFKGQLGQLYKSTSSFSIRLNHQALGRIDVGIKIKDNKVLDAHFQTESAESAKTLNQYKKDIEGIFNDYNIETPHNTIRIQGMQEI